MAWPAQTVASGKTLHLFMGHETTEKLSSPIRLVIENNPDAYKMGLLFPDIMHGVPDLDRNDPSWKEDDLGTYLHSPEFLTQYADYIQRECGTNTTGSCGEVKAHFFGTVGHIVADANTDNDLVGRVKDLCYVGADLSFVNTQVEKRMSGLNDVAQRFTDQTLDQAAFDSLPLTYFSRIKSRGLLKNKAAAAKAAAARKAANTKAAAERKAEEARAAAARKVENTQAAAERKAAEARQKIENTVEAAKRKLQEREQRKNLWNDIQPDTPYVPSVALEVMFPQHKDDVANIRFRNNYRVFRRQAVVQKASAELKPEPGSPRAIMAMGTAEKECPQVIDYASSESWYSGTGGVDEGAEYLEEFIEEIWAVWANGQAAEFTIADGTEWRWLHKELCMTGASSHCMYGGTPKNTVFIAADYAQSSKSICGGE
jgi:transcriptional regulator NrdR family protein